MKTNKNLLMWQTAGLMVLCLVFSGITRATPITLQAIAPFTVTGPDPDVNVAYPTAGDAYCSATNGCGTIPSGGQTALQSTAGDYVLSSIFTDTGLSSATDLSANWSFQDFLGGGNTETWFIYVNGIAVAQAVLPDDNFLGQIGSVAGTVTFANIAPVSGGYQVELILQNTVPSGGGAVAWLDGGTTTLSGVPEPATPLLLSLGLALIGLMRRRKVQQDMV